MATKLTEYEFTAGRSGKNYPWAEWFDGEIWQIKQGTDFESKPKSMRSYLAKVAKDKGVKVRTSLQDDGVVFQAVA